MNNNVGLRSLIPVTTDDDIREQLEARAAVEKMVGAVTPALVLPVQAFFILVTIILLERHHI